MDNNEKYSEFEYKKIRAILKQIEEDVDPDEEQIYSFNISEFEDGVGECLEAMAELDRKETFYDPKKFSLIKGSFWVSGGLPLLHFTMGQSVCTLEFDETLEDENLKVFQEILPFETVISPVWEEVIALFIKKIKVVLQKELKKKKARKKSK